MKTTLYTWGTGSAWGRDLGCLPTDKKARNHTSLSILAGEGKSLTHFLIDIGVPCVESMIDAAPDAGAPMPPPNALFITHPHYDHYGDLMKLVFSRENGWIRNHSHWRLTDAFFADHQAVLSEKAVSALQNMKKSDPDLLHQAVAGYMEARNVIWKRSYLHLNKSYPHPLPVMATAECIGDPKHGIRKQFAFIEDKVDWHAVPESDTWYGVDKKSGRPVPWSDIKARNPDSVHPILFKSLPVWHGPSAPGASLYIFRILDTPESGPADHKKVVVSGDFGSMDESVIQNPDLKNPNILLIENNTVYAENETHSNWIQNKKLISRWFTKECEAKVLLYHLSSSYDWEAGYVPRPMTDSEWRAVCGDGDFKDFRLDIDIAEDGGKYAL